MTRQWRRFLGFTWNGLRHICSWLAMAGSSTIEIKEAAGHRTQSQAARCARLSPQHKHAVVNRIAGTGTEFSNMHQNMRQPAKGKKEPKGDRRKDSA